MPSTEWSEKIPAGEAEAHEGLAKQVAAFQASNARSGAPMRGLHAKANLSVRAEFRIDDAIPPHAKQGLFTSARSLKALVRFSNGGGRKGPDPRPDVRGIAVKLFGVDGPKAIAALSSAKTQDFLLIRTPTIPFRNAADFVWLLGAASKPALLPLKAIVRFGPVAGVQLLRKLIGGLRVPMVSCASTTYFTPVPFRFGTHAAKLQFVAKTPAPAAGPAPTGFDFLHDDLAARLKSGPLEWDVAVQFFESEKQTPIEDPSVEWRVAAVKVGTLVIPQQDVESEAGRALAAWAESLSFDPWHSLDAHRPLGEMNRARNAAYRTSTTARGAAGEPDDLPS